ncbi:hypothetical protein GCM10009678_93950 [Actinomadura kijaniata]
MLTESLVALAAAGSTALVGAMATDAWHVARSGVLRLFGTGTSKAPEEQPGLVARLDADAALVAGAQDAESARQSLLPAWRLRLEEFLREHPEAAEDVRAFTERTIAVLPRPEQHRVQHVVASDHARVFAAQFGNVIIHRESDEPS